MQIETSLKMFLYNIFIIFGIVEGFWPPAYKINLTNEEVFNVGEWDGNDDNGEDEMIKKGDLDGLKLSEDDGRYKRLKEYVGRVRKNTHDGNFHVPMSENETMLDNDDGLPWELFLINNFRKKRYTVDFSFNTENTTKKMNKRIDTDKKEMDNIIGDDSNYIENFNYDDLRKEYELELKEIEKLNLTFDPNNTTENIQNTIKTTNETNKNCTKQEKGIGIKAAKCLFKNMKNAKTSSERKRIALIALKIISIWIGIYIAIALIFWFYKGWCCCCCYCKFCKPRDEIDEVKKFMLDNPPGIYHNRNDEKIIYPYNQYEAYTYNELREQLLSI